MLFVIQSTIKNDDIERVNLLMKFIVNGICLRRVYAIESRLAQEPRRSTAAVVNDRVDHTRRSPACQSLRLPSAHRLPSTERRSIVNCDDDGVRSVAATGRLASPVVCGRRSPREKSTLTCGE